MLHFQTDDFFKTKTCGKQELDIFAVCPERQPMADEGLQHELQFPEDERQGFRPDGVPDDASP